MIKKFTTNSLLALLISVFIIVGCDKNDDAALNKCFLTKTSSTYSKGEVEENTFTFNSDNKIIKSVYTYTAAGQTETSTTTYTYDSKGNLTKEVSDNGDTYTYTYDANNRLTKDENSYNNVLEGRTEYEYNASGQLTKEVYYNISTAGVASKNGYDTYTYANTTTKNPLKRTYFGSTGTEYETYTFEYDDKQTIYSGLGLEAISPLENNVTKKTYTYGSTNSVTTYTYEYNDKGYPTKAVIKTTSSTGAATTYTEAYTYDCK